MSEEWFKWEREGTIHPLFFPLESSMKPLRDYFGASWPDTILIYRGDIVLWCNRMEKLYKLGQKMIDFYTVDENQKKLLKDLEDATEHLKKVFAEIGEKDLGRLSNEELLSLYENFRRVYNDWFKIGWTVEPIALQGEQLIREIIKGQNQKIISILTSTTRKSFSRRSEEDLLRIAKKKKNGQDVSKDIEEYAGKYYWLHNSYFKTQILGQDFFKKDLELTLKERPDPKQYLEEMGNLAKRQKNEKEEMIKELTLEEHRKLIELIDLFGWFQDYRKEYMMQACHYLDVLLAGFGKRAGISAWDMKYTLPKDLPLILDEKFDKNDIDARKKNCIIVWKEFSDDYEFLTGEEAVAKEKEIFPAEEKTNEILEIRGMTACQGLVRGEAFVSMSAEEAKNILPGQILVTSMTSPDFVISMKKAAAIVTNEGGITCHAAIVSREFGVPCIVGTRIATKVLKTGDYIEVDGNHGFVRKLIKE